MFDVFSVLEDHTPEFILVFLVLIIFAAVFEAGNEFMHRVLERSKHRFFALMLEKLQGELMTVGVFSFGVFLLNLVLEHQSEYLDAHGIPPEQVHALQEIFESVHIFIFAFTVIYLFTLLILYLVLLGRLWLLFACWRPYMNELSPVSLDIGKIAATPHWKRRVLFLDCAVKTGLVRLHLTRVRPDLAFRSMSEMLTSSTQILIMHSADLSMSFWTSALTAIITIGSLLNNSSSFLVISGVLTLTTVLPKLFLFIPEFRQSFTADSFFMTERVRRKKKAVFEPAAIPLNSDFNPIFNAIHLGSDGAEGIPIKVTDTAPEDKWPIEQESIPYALEDEARAVCLVRAGRVEGGRLVVTRPGGPRVLKGVVHWWSSRKVRAVLTSHTAVCTLAVSILTTVVDPKAMAFLVIVSGASLVLTMTMVVTIPSTAVVYAVGSSSTFRELVVALKKEQREAEHA
ncbi:hypothetical protein J8273_5721 [Carpediemonas membranifera]|uniref:Uncharacterized protein n=1 Tax=Carpediemonas membranifera TaxID=201153 RepID=A0A8J6B4M9_9EUKA|nr:hypothetical protein J8273_5721 [Carpediemonas membranifera]|eukprot:KAG9392909.1 hypothetical protein J8273_5721 [Carpediemonas membranifera]